MSDTGMRRTGILQIVILLIVAASVNATGIMDTARTITEHLWEQEYIPDSGQPTVPLTEYEEFDVVELFRAETIEDLEAAISDGYPMPWLEEILKDESIPWEDRYWLDCRLRSIFAQDLNLFFDRDGNRIPVEADFIIPGEDYWREHLMVNPVGRTNVPDNLRPTSAFADPGFIMDRFGNQVGELAEVFRFVSMSRDASIAAVISGGPSACFMYPDGTFLEIPLEQSATYESIVSENGEIIAFQCVSSEIVQDPVTYEYTLIVGDVYFYDSNGNLLNRISPPAIFSGNQRCKISCNGRYFCDNLSTGELFITNPLSDHAENLVTASEGGRGRRSSNFSPDGNYLCSGGLTTGLVIDLNSDVEVWEKYQSDSNDYIRIHCSNSAGIIASSTRHGSNPDYYYELEVFAKNQLIFANSSDGRFNEETVVSPNGNFLLSQKDDVKTGDSGIPTVIRQIRGEGLE